MEIELKQQELYPILSQLKSMCDREEVERLILSKCRECEKLTHIISNRFNIDINTLKPLLPNIVRHD